MLSYPFSHQISPLLYLHPQVYLCLPYQKVLSKGVVEGIADVSGGVLESERCAGFVPEHPDVKDETRPGTAVFHISAFL